MVPSVSCRQSDHGGQREHGVHQSLAAEARLGRGPRRVQVQRLGVHGLGGEEGVVRLGDGAARTVEVGGALLVLLEPQAALFDGLLRCGHGHPSSPSERAMSMSWTSVVPSPISRILESR